MTWLTYRPTRRTIKNCSLYISTPRGPWRLQLQRLRVCASLRRLHQTSFSGMCVSSWDVTRSYVWKWLATSFFYVCTSLWRLRWISLLDICASWWAVTHSYTVCWWDVTHSFSTFFPLCMREFVAAASDLFLGYVCEFVRLGYVCGSVEDDYQRLCVKITFNVFWCVSLW